MSSRPVALVIGASRGMGRQMAIDLSKNGYTVIVSAKSTSSLEEGDTDAAQFPPDPNSSKSTITTVAREIELAGGTAAAIPVDVRDYDAVCTLVEKVISVYSRLNVLVYNPGAIYWSAVFTTPYKRFRLMQQVNSEGLYAAVQASLPHLRQAASSADGDARIVVVSPPIYSRFFRGKTAYAMGKVAMSVLTMGLAMDIDRDENIKGKMSVTSLWPAVGIESAATRKFTASDPEELRNLRKSTIFSHAVLAVLRSPAEKVNGRLLIDEDFLREIGAVMDFSHYSVVPGSIPRRIMPARLPDLTVEEQDDEGRRFNSADITEQTGAGKSTIKSKM